ncbi:hypothetical protein V2I01_07145 [Micromonospora sp. BRA006-A]|nr:hypothetical protein [Micromonospora sp. BRA006-A]
MTLHAAPLLRVVRGPGGLGAGRAGVWALEAAAQAVALLALLLTGGSLRYAAAVCVLWGVAVAVRVSRRGESPAGRRVLAAVAAGSELVGAWLLLAAGGWSCWRRTRCRRRRSPWVPGCWRCGADPG